MKTNNELAAIVREYRHVRGILWISDEDLDEIADRLERSAGVERERDDWKRTWETEVAVVQHYRAQIAAHEKVCAGEWRPATLGYKSGSIAREIDGVMHVIVEPEQPDEG